MFKTYLTEIVLSLAVAFMAIYPPQIGVIVFALALSLLVGLRVIEQLEKKKAPEVVRLENDLRDIKAKVDQLILGRGR